MPESPETFLSGHGLSRSVFESARVCGGLAELSVACEESPDSTSSEVPSALTVKGAGGPGRAPR
eukprot:528566-Rhodomonas_salina.4